jgi:hypothetical protein
MTDFDRGLQFSPEKSCITHIEEGFDFLGQNTRKYDSRLLTTPAKKNLHAFLEKVRTVIPRNRAAKQENLIWMLNPIIRGWANYHRHIVATLAFRKVEMVVWRCLWRWAKRRHLHKSVDWIAKRYWHRLGRRRRSFAVRIGVGTSHGKPLTEWGKVLHDEDLAAAILDRVLERGRFVHLDGPSGRTRHLNLEEASPAKAERLRISGTHTMKRLWLDAWCSNSTITTPELCLFHCALPHIAHIEHNPKDHLCYKR